MLKIGILGMGGMGWFHTSRIFQLPQAKLVAIADVRPDRLEARHAVTINIENREGPVDLSGVARFPDASRLIAEADVDIVDICLPSYLHARYAVEALQAGKHVLCEKPMALNAADAGQMIAAAGKAGRRLMIAQVIRFWPEYRYLRRCVKEGIYGRLLSLNFYRISGRPIWSWENWMLDPALSGGAPYDLHIHDVDYTNSLLGLPDAVQASRRVSDPPGSYDIIHASYHYQDGPQVHIHGGWGLAQIPFKAGFEAWFERGFVRLDPGQDPALVVYEDQGRVEPRPADCEPGDAYLNEIAYFLDCVEKDYPPEECPPESARDSLVLLEKELASVERKMPVIV
jgi:predicted dehydrogenase